MINVAEIPDIPGDMGVLHTNANKLGTVGTQFPDTGSRIHSTWQGLSPHYLAPESAQLFAATGPIPTVTASVGEDLGTVAGALNTYATEVAAIQTRLDTLRATATDFNTTVVDANPDEWRKDEDDVNRHNQILGDINTAVADFMAAQRRCANTILALYSPNRYVEENGDGTVSKYEFGYTAEQLNGALEHDEGLPWGTAEEHDRGFFGDVGAFFGGIGTGFVDMVKGLGALIGYGEDGWSWANAGNAWKGLGLLAMSLNVTNVVVNQFVDLPGIPKGTLGNTLLNAGKSIIAYDTWGEDKSKAAGMTVFNVVSAVVGTKGAGAGLKGAGAAAQASRFGAVVKVGAGMVRAGEFVARIPTVSEVALGTINKVRGFHLPPINLPDAGVNPTHVDAPRVDIPDTPRVDTPSSSGGRPSVGDALPGGDRTPGLPGGGVADGPPVRVPEVPEPARVGADAPEPASVGADAPEPARVGADAPDPARVGAEAPPARVGAEAPEPVRVGAEAPDPVRVGAEAPDPVRVGAEAPDPVRVGAEAPAPVRVGADGADGVPIRNGPDGTEPIRTGPDGTQPGRTGADGTPPARTGPDGTAPNGPGPDGTGPVGPGAGRGLPDDLPPSRVDPDAPPVGRDGTPDGAPDRTPDGSPDGTPDGTPPRGTPDDAVPGRDTPDGPDAPGRSDAPGGPNDPPGPNGPDGAAAGDAPEPPPGNRVDGVPDDAPHRYDDASPEHPGTGTQPDGSWRGMEEGRELYLPPELNQAANALLDGARASERGISGDIHGVARGIPEGTVRGFDHVFKDPISLKRKIASWLAENPGLRVSELQREINDSLRYTIEVPPGNYAQGVQDAVAAMRARGYENVNFKVRWDDPNSYHGVNSTWIDPRTGQLFELQFHTPASLHAKTITHPIYQAERLATDDAARAALAEQQAAIFRGVEVPSGAGALDDLNRSLADSRVRAQAVQDGLPPLNTHGAAAAAADGAPPGTAGQASPDGPPDGPPPDAPDGGSPTGGPTPDGPNGGSPGGGAVDDATGAPGDTPYGDSTPDAPDGVADDAAESADGVAEDAAGTPEGVADDAAKPADEVPDPEPDFGPPPPGVPDGWQPRVADNGQGVVYQRTGAAGNADMVRVMEPNALHPQGYVRFYNSHGQPVGLDGKPGSKNDSHLDMDENGDYPLPEGW